MKTAERQGLTIDKSNSANVPAAEKDAALLRLELTEELLGVLLHDLRSPLGAIGVLADVIGHSLQAGQEADARQLKFMQDAVIKTQRILEDAVEIQSILRKSCMFAAGPIELRTLTRNALEKAQHAPYFHHARLDYDAAHGDAVVLVDIEKAENALLCILEHLIKHTDSDRITIAHHSTERSGIIEFRINNCIMENHDDDRLNQGCDLAQSGLRGKLGNRRLGESRFNLELCTIMLELMGGSLAQVEKGSGLIVRVEFPRA